MPWSTGRVRCRGSRYRQLAGDMRVFLTGLLRSRGEASRVLAAVSGEIATNPELRQACIEAWPGC